MIEKNVKMTQTSKSQKFKSKHQLKKKCKVNFQNGNSSSSRNSGKARKEVSF